MKENPPTSIRWEEVDRLWFRLKEGDRDGLEGIYRLFAPALFRHGLSLIPDTDFVQDCIQEVFIDLWKYHLNLPQADNVKMYLFKSLSHKIYRENKKKQKRKKEDIGILYETCYLMESPETEIMHFQRDVILQKKLAAALLKLPVRQKEVIQHLFFENFSYEETSKIMGINLKSVYTLAWKSISHLKKSMLLYTLLVLC